MKLENFFICLCFCACIWGIQDLIIRLVKDSKKDKKGHEENEEKTSK